MDRNHGIIFLVVVLSVPIQYYLSPSSTSDIKYNLQRLTDSIFSYASQLGISLPMSKLRNDGKKEESIDDDAEIQKPGEVATKDMFAGSLEVRERAPNVLFRIGDVVQHKEHGYRGVVIGWDLTAKAPKRWLEAVRKKSSNEDWMNQPNYAVLIDTRDRLGHQLGYMVQGNTERSKGRVLHTLLEHYMESYDANTERYSPRPWLRRVYPDD